MDHESVIVGDIESTGVKPDSRIVEIAWVEVDDQLEIIDQVASIIDPEIPIPSHVSGINNIADEDVWGKPTIDEFFDQMCPDCLTKPTLLVAHNAQFDIKYFQRLTDNMTGSLCTLRLARHFFPHLENHQLSTLKYEFKLTRHAGHRALNDVLNTLEFLRVVMQHSEMTLPQLIDFANKPIEIKAMPWGKHKGAPIGSLPPSYMKWLLTKCENLDPELRTAVEKARR